MDNPILRVKNLSHRYATSWAIRDINLEINQTGIVGLLGSNGAGKSTTMNIFCGVLNQTEGTVEIDGVDLRKNPELAKRQIGFLPQNPPLYMELTVDEYLVHCAHLRLIEKSNIRKSVEEAKERCAIGHFSNRLITNLSGGYKQRVGIAQAILHHPKLVVLDEPTNGLDPNQIIEVRSLIKEIALEHAVIFSTHILTEVQMLCKEIKMIESGRMVFEDTMDAFNNYMEPNSLIARMDNPPAEADLFAIPGVSKIEFLTGKQMRIFFNDDQEIADKIITKSVQSGWKLKEINFEKSSLDEIFAQLSNKKK